MGGIHGMQIIHTKDYVPVCTSSLCGFTFNTPGPTFTLMEDCEKLEISIICKKFTYIQNAFYLLSTQGHH